MAVTLDFRVLQRLQWLIEETGIHDGPVDEPVDITPLLEDFTQTFAPLPAPVQALVMRWRSAGIGFADISYNARLKPLNASAEKREASAHEFAHVFCRHTGQSFVMWRAGYGPDLDPFGVYLDDIQERQCRAVSAYLLVRREALYQLRELSASEMALLLNVPAHLVELRWSIWRKFGR